MSCGSSPRCSPGGVAASAAARPAMVGRRKKARIGTSVPKRSRTRASSWAASREWPPLMKKLASTLASSRPKSSHQSWCTAGSKGSRGAIRCLAVEPAASSLAGSELAAVDLEVGRQRQAPRPARRRRAARRPAGCFRGKRAGSPGSPPRLEAGSPAGSKKAASCFSPRPSSTSTTAQAPTPGWRPSALSTSPSSMRKPRSLTWLSIRPRYSRAPPASSRIRSPVR